MTSANAGIEGKCQICEIKQENLIDIENQKSGYIKEKIQAVTNFKDNECNWLRFMCTCCKEKLDDFWEFGILCKNAYKKFLENKEELEKSSNFNSIPQSKASNVSSRGKDASNKYSEGWEDAIGEMDSIKEECPKSPKDRDPLGKNEWDLLEENYRKEKFDKKSRKNTSQIISFTSSQLKNRKTIRKCENGEKKENTYAMGTEKLHTKFLDQISRNPRKSKALKTKEIGPFICDICDKSYAQKNTLRMHISVVHKKKQVSLCVTCGKTFISHKKLARHVLIHDENRIRAPCNICGKTFSSKENARKHVLVVHLKTLKPQKIRCCRCRDYFPKDAYEQHLRDSHGVDRSKRKSCKGPLKCSFCTKEFKSMESFTNHENIHRDIKPFVCDICSKAFRQKGHLQMHMNGHAKKRFPCEHCDKSFTHPATLKVHTRIHTGEKPYQCPHCLERFNELKKSRKHILKCAETLKNHSAEILGRVE